MANSTKREIVQKLQREERMAIRATRFKQKPNTIRQTKRTIRIAVFCGVSLLLLTILRFTALKKRIDPFANRYIAPSPVPGPTGDVPHSTIEELEKDASPGDVPPEKAPR